MPPKTVTCSICNQEVLKSKTWARADGTRACRNHDGIAEEAQKLQEQDKQRLAKETTHREHAQETRWKKDATAHEQFKREAKKLREYADSHCWTCGREGISQQEYWANVMVAQKRLELRGEFNLLTLQEDIQKLTPGYKVLIYIPYNDEKDHKIRQAITDRRFKDIIHLLRRVNMCGPCIETFGVKDRYTEQLPDVSIDQLEALMPVVDLIDPLLTEIAKRKETQN